MIPPEGGAATGAAEETAPEQTQSLSEEILGLMRGEEPVAPGQQTEEVPPEEIPGSQEPEVPPQQETDEEPEEETDQVLADQWPQSAKKRVAEESEKRRRAKERADNLESERNHWYGVAQDLQGRLQEASMPRPSASDPLADVYDATDLRKAESQYLNIKASTTRALDENPTDAEIEVVVGKDKDGQPITESYSRKRLTNMKLAAEHALTVLIPQKAKLMAAREQAEAVTVKVYPQFAENDGDNEWAAFVRQTLAEFPELSRVPDISMWLGHALEGRRVTVERLQKERGTNGAEERSSIPPNTVAKRILSTPRIRSAPPTAARRVPSQTMPSRGADVEAARKTMKARPGDDDAMEAFIDAKLFKGASRGYSRI